MTEFSYVAPDYWHDLSFPIMYTFMLYDPYVVLHLLHTPTVSVTFLSENLFPFP